MRYAWTALIFLTACSPVFKIIKDRNPKVISRLNDKECPLVWLTVKPNMVEEAYGHPCDVVIRHDELVPVEMGTGRFKF